MCNAGKWGTWELLATATKPQEIALPLAAGWTTGSVSSYYKTQDGVTTVTLNPNNMNNTDYTPLVATLPAGYRPTRMVQSVGVATAETGELIAAWLRANPDGTIQIFTDKKPFISFGGQITFVAAN